MRTYEITYNKKTVRARGENTLDAVQRYGARQPFGGNTIFHLIHTKMIDADTRGEKWGEFWTEGPDGTKIHISAKLK